MTPLPDTLLEAVASAAVREGLADAVFTRLQHPDRPPAGRPGRARHRPRRLRGGARGRVLAEVAAALGPRIVASDRELAATRDALDGLPRGRGRHARAARRPRRSSPRRSGARCSRRCTTPCAAARSSPTARSPSAPGNPRAYRAAATACARNPVPIVVPCHRVLPGQRRDRQLRRRRRRASARCSSSRARCHALGSGRYVTRDLDRVDHDRLGGLPRSAGRLATPIVSTTSWPS